MKKIYNFIDLFAGCGGLSEGFLQTGKYNGLAHVEWETPMIETLRTRLVEKWNHTKDDARKRVIKFDVQKTEELIHGNWNEETRKLYEKENHPDIVEKGLAGLVGKEPVDLIIGGPPCQAYSLAGRAQDPHSMKDDYRNYLFESFVKIVDYFKPKVFVFENVPGLLSACPGDIPVRIRIYEAFKAIGYDIRTPENLKNSVYCAEDFDVPQKRNRIIIIGVRHNSNFDVEEFYESLSARKNTTHHKTVRDAIGNLPVLIPSGKVEKIGRANVSHVQESGEKIDHHEPRYHGFRDQKLFKEWLANNMNKYSQQAKMEFYTKITGHTSNHVKYRNLEWDKPSPTIVAHLYKDGYMFIHPDIRQLRTITMREAALLQSFPLDYSFPVSNSYAYRMIGNAVPVLFAKGIAEAVYEVLIKKDVQ
jgi:DNA (cytosine-5)-methyltransferase 1